MADFHDVATGTTRRGRNGLEAALQMLDTGQADVLLATKLDRVSRSVSDFAGLLDRARRNGWAVKLLDPDIDLTTATGELVAGILSQVVQWEARIISERTTVALAEVRRNGTRLGRPVEMDPKVRRRIVRMRARGMSLQRIADTLNGDGTPTATPGARWHASTINRVVRSTA